MKWIRSRVLSGELTAGCFIGLGSSMSAEIAGRAGFDWVLMDMEHGAGGHLNLIHQLQAVAGTPAAPIVRIEWNEPPRFKRVLDLGPAGVMVPYVNDAQEAKRAVESMRYPPEGIRGVAIFTRASGFGQEFDEYYAEANKELLTIVQIETRRAVANASPIASVAGVDVLFIGPVDLSFNSGYPRQFDHPDFLSAKRKVVSACRQEGKAAGIFLTSLDQVEGAVRDGFTFIALGSDGGALAAGLRRNAAGFQKYR